MYFLSIMVADVLGLSVSYEHHVPTSTLAQNVKKATASLPSSCYNTRVNVLDSSVKAIKALERLCFENAAINKPLTRKFIIRNRSGIGAKFRIRSEKYRPAKVVKAAANVFATPIRASKQFEPSALTQLPSTAKKLQFSISSKCKSTGTKKKKVYIIDHPILTEENKQFASPIGETYTATKKAYQEQNLYLERSKGVVVVCRPEEGDLAPYSEVIVAVTLYNNVCGKYEDRLISEVGGLDTTTIPVAIDIRGSPVVIPPTQVGVYFNEDPPVLAMKPIVNGTGKISKTFKVKNTGGQDMIVDWKIFDVADTGGDLFKLSFTKSEGDTLSPYKINFDALEPTEESRSTAFAIEPRRLLLSSREQATFEVAFSSDRPAGKCQSLLVAHPTLAREDPDSASPRNLGALYLTLRGEALRPHLTIDKKCRMDGKAHVQFDIWSSNTTDAPSLSRKINFTNDLGGDIAVTLETKGDFAITGTATNSGTHPLAKGGEKVQTLFSLRPGSFLEVRCRADKGRPSEVDRWPLVERVSRQGALLLNYSNKSCEQIVLQANYLRPRVTVDIKDSTMNSYGEQEYDFGAVFIDEGKYKDLVIFLRNETKVTAKWRLNHIKNSAQPKEQIFDDQSVFAFSEAEVILPGRRRECSKGRPWMLLGCLRGVRWGIWRGTNSMDIWSLGN